MSARALGFVEEWVAENVRADTSGPGGEPPAGDNSRAKALATQCLADANAQGTATEIGEAIDDLTEFMTGAIEEANDLEAHGSEDEDEEDSQEGA